VGTAGVGEAVSPSDSGAGFACGGADSVPFPMQNSVLNSIFMASEQLLAQPSAIICVASAHDPGS
jgi:hypothetical protein